MESPELVRDTGDSVRAEAMGFDDHALVGFEAALVDDACDLGDFAAEESSAGGGEGAEQAHREDGVADDEFAGREVLEVEAVDFVAGQAGHDGHGESVSGRGRWSN